MVEASQKGRDDSTKDGASRDLDGDIEMSAEEFDGVMEQCSRERSKRDHREPPPRKEAKKVITPQNQNGSNDE